MNGIAPSPPSHAALEGTAVVEYTGKGASFSARTGTIARCFLNFRFYRPNDKIKVVGFSSDVVGTFSSEIVDEAVERISPI
jgi:hypothetical protein